MLTGLPILLLAFASSLVLTPLARMLGFRFRILDASGNLSIHTQPVPRTGGLAMFVGFLAASGYAWATSSFAGGQGRTFAGIMIGATVVFLTGLLDDIKWLSPREKFIGELLGAGIAIGLGLQVRTFPLVGVGILLALFYLVGGANALNLLDGMDGLAAGTAAIAAFFFAILATGRGNTLTMVLAMAILGTTLGFLPYNWGISNFKFQISNLRRRDSNAAIFMGDSGSLFLGFTLSSIAVLFAARPYDLVGFITPLLVISVPILDTALAILRRFIHAMHPFGGDRQHVYDLLSRGGLGDGRAVLVIHLAGLVLGGLSLVMIRLDPLPAILLGGGIVLLMVVAAVRLGAVMPPAARQPGTDGAIPPLQS